MDRSKIELWNVHEGITNYVGAQRIFNVLGHVKNPEQVHALSYCLNDGPVTPIVFKKRGIKAGQRLEQEGDFNIDTINIEHVRPKNKLILIAHLEGGNQIKRVTNFPACFEHCDGNSVRLNLNQASYPQEVGQIVDGRWRLTECERGERYLEIAQEDAGLDRIILLAHRKFRVGYTIKARLQVTSWVGMPHNIGLVFMWNPHQQGNGEYLPSQWTTGLGYYYSDCPGLRIRLGINVHLNSKGDKIGDYILGEQVFSFWRYWMGRTARKLLKTKKPFSQLPPGKCYEFELIVHKDLYALTVWKQRNRKCRPQVMVHNPPELLLEGAAGIIAHRCGVRVSDFEIIPQNKAS